jgi:Tfp pilus assembly protein PilX
MSPKKAVPMPGVALCVATIMTLLLALVASAQSNSKTLHERLTEAGRKACCTPSMGEMEQALFLR